MTQQYTHSITKEAISELPLEEFTGRIIVIDTLRDVEKAVGYLSEFQSVGFDTETRPSFKKGQRYKISLMQISTDEACFLFRLNRIGIPEALEEFLANEKVLKIGLSLRDDFGAMRKRTGHTTRQLPGLAELCRAVRHRRRQPAKDIRHPLQQENLERTASEQLGSRRPQRRTEKICSP